MDDERTLVERLRARDENAFVELVESYYSCLLPLADFYVSNKAVAEEVVQETWLAVLRGIDRFEERSSFKTWISRIVMNIARTRGVRESRMVAFSEFADSEGGPDEPAVDPERFRKATDEYPDHWSMAPRAWNSDPETQLLTSETIVVSHIFIRYALRLKNPRFHIGDNAYSAFETRKNSPSVTT